MTDHTAPPKRWELAFYAIVRAVLVTFARIWFRLGARGLQHVPDEGPFIIAPVHRSNLDFLLVLVTTRRRIRYLGKDSVFRGFFGRILRALGGIPVTRGTADREALQTCIEVIRAGEPLVVFPEGTRQTGPIVQEFFDGAAFIQSRTGAPILPVGIGGSESAMPKGAKMIRPQRIRLVIGEALPAPVVEGAKARRTAIRSRTAELHDIIQRLYDEAQIDAGTPNRT